MANKAVKARGVEMKILGKILCHNCGTNCDLREIENVPGVNSFMCPECIAKEEARELEMEEVASE